MKKAWERKKAQKFKEPKEDDYIPLKDMIDILGGKIYVEANKRLSGYCWQSEKLLGSKVTFKDFVYIL